MRLKAAVEFAERLMRLEVAANVGSGRFPLQWHEDARNCIIDLRAITAQSRAPISGIPQGPEGHVLLSEASGVRWGNPGDYLTDWIAAVDANGGTLTNRSIAIAAMLSCAVEESTWGSKIQLFLPFLGADLDAALTPLVDRLSLGSPTNTNFVDGDFTEADGLQGAGTKYLDAGVTPSGLGTSNNGGLGWWETSWQSIGACMGMFLNPGGGTRSFTMNPRGTTGEFYWNQDIAGRGAIATGTYEEGHYYGQRSSPTSRELFFNGTLAASGNSDSDTGTGAGSKNILISGVDASSGKFGWSGRAGCAYLTDGTMTADEVAEFHAVLRDSLIRPLGRVE